jgi:two-component system response regulator
MQPRDLPTILLAEDNFDDHDALVRSFKKVQLQCQVAWCRNGQEAINYLSSGTGKAGIRMPLPELIILDLNMAGVDGRKTLKIIKEDDALKLIPVVVLTTSSSEGDVDFCYRAGANSYIQKPRDLEGLLDVAKRIKDYWFGVARLPHASS